MSESMRDRLRDELAGWPIGSGYYSTTVSVEDARDMADALLAAFPVLAGVTDEMVEAGVRAVNGLDWTQTEFGEVPHERDIARAVLTAVFGSRDADAPGDGSTT